MNLLYIPRTCMTLFDMSHFYLFDAFHGLSLRTVSFDLILSYFMVNVKDMREKNEVSLLE